MASNKVEKTKKNRKYQRYEVLSKDIWRFVYSPKFKRNFKKYLTSQEPLIGNVDKLQELSTVES
jgi:hypothetical protein